MFASHPPEPMEDDFGSSSAYQTVAAARMELDMALRASPPRRGRQPSAEFSFVAPCAFPRTQPVGWAPPIPHAQGATSMLDAYLSNRSGMLAEPIYSPLERKARWLVPQPVSPSALASMSSSTRSASPTPRLATGAFGTPRGTYRTSPLRFDPMALNSPRDSLNKTWGMQRLPA